jgi:hypothetical protein
MAKYLLTYHGGGMPETEEEGAKVMAAWGAWMGSLGPALVDQGNPVGPSAVIANDGTTAPSHGSDTVTGYSIIEAADMDAALALAKDCPIRADGGSVEVGEIVPM